MQIALVTPPAAEPVTLTEARLHCRIDSSAEDPLLSTWITAAREEAEVWTERTIPAQTWTVYLDRFPFYDGPSAGGMTSSPRSGATGDRPWEWLESQRIRLPRPPLVSVTSIVYVDTAGVSQTLAADQYLVSARREPGTVEPAYGVAWPVNRYQADAVAITYVAGWPCTSVAAAIGAGAQTVTPASMAGIKIGSVLSVDPGANAEHVAVSAVSATTFTATFAQAHAAGALVRAVPARIVSAILLAVGWKYANREPVKAELDAWQALLTSASSGGYP